MVLLLRRGSVALAVVGLTSLSRTADADGTGPPTPANVRVHIVSSRTTFLYRRPAGGDEQVMACESPCDLDLPTGDTYLLGGSGLSTTSDFKLEANRGGTVVLDVSGPNWAGVGIGSALVFIGGYLGLGGSAATIGQVPCAGCKNENAVAIPLLFGLAAAAIAGGWLMVHYSLKTGVSQSAGVAPPSESFVRSPSWQQTLESHAAPAELPLVFEQKF